MSTPPDILSQILQGGLLSPGSPNALNSGLMGADPSSQVGMQLLANSSTPGKFGSILGKSMLGAQQQQQANAQNQMSLIGQSQDLRMKLAQQQMLQNIMQRFMGGGSAPGPQQPGQQGAPAGAPGPQGAPQAAQQPPQQAPPQATPQGQPDISQTPVNGIPADFYRALDMASGKDPIETEKSLRALQMQTVQQQVKPTIDGIDTIIKSDNPSQYVKASPTLMQHLQAGAQSLGINLNAIPPAAQDQAVRTALTARRNQLAANAGLGIEAPPVPLKTVQTGLGGSYQVNPVDNKISSGAPQQETGQFVLPDGTIKLMTKAQGMSRGLSPYEAGTYVNPGTSNSVAHQIATYRMAPLTSQALRTAQGQDIMRQVTAENPQYDSTQYDVKKKAREAFASGSQGNTVRSLSVATDHLDQLGKAALELNNTGIQGANKVANWFSQQTGNPAVTNFDSMKEIVGDEVVKAVVGTSGASGDREAIKSTFSNAHSPDQILGAIQKYKGLMSGQLNGLRQQYQKNTGMNDFDDMLTQNARSQLGGGVGVGQSQTIGGFTVTRVK